MISFARIAAAAVLSLVTSPALSDSGFGILVGHSKHSKVSELNDETPGAGFGYRWDTRYEGLELNTQAFVYKNSYEETSPALLAGVSYELIDVGPLSFHAGISIGTARYVELSSKENMKADIPDWNGFIPAALVSLETRVFDRVGAVFSMTPVSAEDRAYNASMRFYLGR